MKVNTFLDLFMYQVAEHGAKPAVIDPETGRQMTYAELDEYAGRAAAKMRENGVKHGDCIALVMPGCLDEVAAMLAAMKAGASFTILNSQYPADRLEYIYRDCSARLIVTRDFFADVNDFAPAAPQAEAAGDDIAMIVYTSGSTGKPKGVVIDQQGLCGSIHDIVSEEDVFGQGAPLFFIAGSKLLLTGLAKGCTNVLVPSETMRDPELLSAFLAEQRITVVFISPKVLRYFKPSGDTLRRVIAGSERLSGICSDQFEIYNTFGMSETIGDILHFKVDRAYDNTPVGRPIGNEGVYILDENGCEAAEGEICVTGHIAKEYLNLPEETAGTFVPNPFKDKDGFDVMLKTGDMGSMLPDGNILFMNRKDWMVKINGQRVEPGEIEAELRRIDGVMDSAVKDFPDETGQIFLAAYYVSEEEKDETALREALLKKLPEYMIPAFFVRLERLPLNANGKLDRSALPKPEPIMPKTDILPPQNEVQQRIFDCVAEVIGSENFGVTTSIYDAGLSSIGAIHLNALLSRTFDVPVSIRDLQEHPTIVGLEEFLGGPVRREDRPVQADYPLTRTQQAVLSETLRYPDTTIYNIPLLLKLSEGVDPARLKEAVQQAIEAHPYLLGTIFTDEHGQYRISRHDSAAAEVELVHLAQLPQELVKPFDIVGGRLYRARIIMTGSGNYLFLDCHHIVFDGTSAVILLQDINAAYAGTLSAGKEYLGYEIALDEEEQRDTDMPTKNPGPTMKPCCLTQNQACFLRAMFLKSSRAPVILSCHPGLIIMQCRPGAANTG